MTKVGTNDKIEEERMLIGNQSKKSKKNGSNHKC
jgi:hypothetical protein